MADIQARLEYLRGELRAERMSYSELAELQGLAEHIDPSDMELLEAAGVPEGHDPNCMGCEHDCPWKNNPMGSPYCQVCDDHNEAIGEDDDDDMA